MKECKELWQLESEDMYNTAPMVLYDAYLVNMGHTISSRLSKICGKTMRVNLRQGNASTKIQITVTTVHQTKYRLTKLGNGFGYGTVEKINPEDAFLSHIFDRAAPEVRQMRKLEGQRETLASLVPPIIKKAPKAVTDSLKALHLTCRRGMPIDRNGMPILVKKGQRNQAGMVAVTNHIQGEKSRELRRLPAAESRLVSNTRNDSIGMLTRNSSSNRRLVMSHSPLKLRGKDWIYKVDDLIGKFDESFRENQIQQKQIREAQDELEIAKKQILQKMNEDEVHLQLRQAYGSDGSVDESYKKDSCAELPSQEDFGDDEVQGAEEETEQVDTTAEPSRVNSKEGSEERRIRLEKREDKASMRRTMQTKEQREEYELMCQNLSEKFNNLHSMANDALKSKWDTRGELMRVASKPNSIVRIKSIQASKKSFKRDRKIDTQILNHRSSELLLGSNQASQKQFLTPQQLYEHMEKLRLQKEIQDTKAGPSLRSKAERQLQLLRDRKAKPENQVQLLELGTTKSRVKKQETAIQKYELQIEGAAGQVTPKQKKKILNADLMYNSAGMKDRHMMNDSVMSQLTQRGSQSVQPVAKLPKKLEQRKQKGGSQINRDIEAFISATPTKRTSGKYQLAQSSKSIKGSSMGGSPRCDLKHEESDIQMTNVQNKLMQQRSQSRAMNSTMPDIGKNYATTEMTSTMYDSERNRLNQNNIDNMRATQKMQVVLEADENYQQQLQQPSLKRPKFFQTMHLSIKTKKKAAARDGKKSGTRSPVPAKEKVPAYIKFAAQTQQMTDEIPINQLANTTSSPGNLSIKALKAHQMNMTRPSIRKPPVPSFSSVGPPKNSAQSSGPEYTQLSTLRSTRGLTSTKQLDLKPIDHTQHAKFTPHPNCFERFRTKLPKGTAIMQTTRSGGGVTETSANISPYQLMLEEMKEGNIARPNIQDDLGDSQEFRAGEITVQNKQELSVSYLAYEERLENVMRQTQSTILGGAALPQTTERNQALNTAYSKEIGPVSSQYRQKFQQEAVKLVEDARRFEEISSSRQHGGGQSRQSKHAMARMTMQNPYSRTRNDDYQDASFQNKTQMSGFGMRNTSLNLNDSRSMAPFNNSGLSLKEKLRQLKMQEANNYNKQNTMKSGFKRRRRTEYDAGTVADFKQHRSNFAGAGTGGPEESSEPEADSHHLSSENSGSLEPSRFAAVGGATGQIGGTGRGLYGFAGGSGDAVNTSQVSYTFKQFTHDSKRDHTRHLLPSVIKFK